MNEKFNLSDVSFLFAVRIESPERLENIRIVIAYLLRYFKTPICIVEADSRESGLREQCPSESVEFTFIEDNDPVFHKTKYVNWLARQVKTPFVAVWDADVIVHPIQIQTSTLRLRNATVDFIFPYDGRFLDTGIRNRIAFINSYDIRFLEKRSDKMRLPYTANACGGGFFANREAYIKAGMENEMIYGWGPDDVDRLNRWRTLQMRVGRVKGPMFHLSHPRPHSDFKSEIEKIALFNEIERIKRMTVAELEQEIQTWHR